MVTDMSTVLVGLQNESLCLRMRRGPLACRRWRIGGVMERVVAKRKSRK